MNALGFAWLTLVRQPARAVLGVLGVAAVGALLFDMLLLSQGLIVSMRDLLDRTGWDVRVASVDPGPGPAPPMPDADRILAAITRLPEVRAAVGVRFVRARVMPGGTRATTATLMGVDGTGQPPWTLLRGADPRAANEVVINDEVARVTNLGPGDAVMLRASCIGPREALPPLEFRITGIATFPLDASAESTIAGRLAAVERACAGNAADEIDWVLVTSNGDPSATAAAITRARPELRTLTNEQMIGRFQQNGFTYFRQISTVLTTVTVAFALLLITVLLTVSVNQRLGEIAALRALGFSRRRVVADVLSESALIVGSGGLLSLPLGLALARGLDRILTAMPGIPADLHFFVFEPRALVIHVVLLVVTAVVAALYPMRIVARLPIAATLRAEVIG